MPRLRPVSFFLVLVAASVLGGESGQSAPSSPACSESWYRSIEARLPTSDAQGHGPDVGSEEWKSAIEFQLGIRDESGVPDRDGDDWCRYVDRLVRERGGEASVAATPRGPSYACDKVRPGSIEAMICGDDELSALDRTLADVYAAASKRAADEHPPRLAAEQRGWIKGRDECWKSDDKHGCVRDEYRRRNAELQAR